MSEKLERMMVQAQKARELQDNPLLIETFDKLTAAYIEQWKITRFDDSNGRDRLWQAVNIIGKVRQQLGVMVENGKIAKADLLFLQGQTTTR